MHLSTCDDAYYSISYHKSLMIFMTTNTLPLLPELYRMKINNKTKKIFFQNMVTRDDNMLISTDVTYNEMVYLVLKISEAVALF